MNSITQAQKLIKEAGIDGWLLYDFRKNNELAHIFLKIPTKAVMSRRFFYWIPKEGEPIKLVHAIEDKVLDSLPGKKQSYLSWQSLEEELGKILKGKTKVAMEYSENNQIPYVSRVDAGTVDLIRSFGCKVVSSADLLAHFTSVLSSEQIESQKRAGIALDEIVQTMWDWITSSLKNQEKITEYQAQQKICDEFKKRNLITDHDPIVAVNAHSADPHFEPLEDESSEIKMGDFILIDLWAKEDHESAVFADITRVAVAASTPTEKQEKIFQIVRQAQQKAVDLIETRIKKGERVEGREVDDAARKVITDAGYGQYFIHRLGHSIERSLHGSGTHMDNLEIHDVRPILENTCFSIEPGIYLPGEFGVRLEFDILILEGARLIITGGYQDQIARLF